MKKVFSILCFTILIPSLLMGCSGFSMFSGPQSFSEKTISGSGSEKIALIHVTGIISSLPRQGFLNTKPSILQETVAQLRLAEKDSSVKAIILAINSPGGGVTASDILYHEISRIRKNGKKLIYTLMMDVTASGGYYIALASNKIVAHPTTITGSIGVITTRIGVEKLLNTIGINIYTTKSGSMKDIGSPFRQPTPAENAVFTDMIQNMNERFQNLVVENRPNAKKNSNDYTNGKILTAGQALSIGLIDSIGYFDDVVTAIQSELQIESSKVITYKRSELPNGTEYNSAIAMPQLGENSLLPNSFSLQTGFYYLWLPTDM